MMSLGTPSLTKGVRAILIATIAVYVFQILPGTGRFVDGVGMLIPYAVFRRFQVWRLFTYMWLHAGPMHLFFNMLALWMFGMQIEVMWGTKKFVAYYILAGIISGAFAFFMPSGVRIVGASGAVLAALTAFAFYYPHVRVLMFFIFPVPALIAVGIIGFISIALATSNAGGIAHLIHLGGIVVGVVYIKAWPIVHKQMQKRNELARERHMRRTAEERVNRQRYYEDVVDPILKKISQQGMESLTKQEREILKKASKEKNASGGKGKIIPFKSSQ
jgi:membrane associated rhomboid family serine protease